VSRFLFLPTFNNLKKAAPTTFLLFVCKSALDGLPLPLDWFGMMAQYAILCLFCVVLFLKPRQR